MVKNEIKVFARLKPESREKNILSYQIYRRPKKNVEEDYLVLNAGEKSSNDYINNRPENWNFAFHQIFDRHIKQDEIFQYVAKPIVQSVLNGYNATIFAYGQTGSGKTFSITGDPKLYEDRGVIPRTVQYLFETIQENPENIYSVEIAYLEIYNENGYDLLDPKHDVVTKLEELPRVTIQEDENGILHLKNLSFRTVDNEKDALALLFLGDTNRSISETPMNPQSSRSHCIFTIAVSVKKCGSENLSKAKIHLVDLAGSERVYKCCISGNILTEAKYINLSLHYLEQVIVCLGQPNVSHIPYRCLSRGVITASRNSLLTAILRDSLGGNCLTTMLATLSLNTSNFEETISTCRFSQRVSLIKNDVNLVLARNPEDENKFLKIEIERLRKQIAQLTTDPLTLSEELTTKEKRDLDNQVDDFLRSDLPIDWAKDERKVKYCLKILRDKLKTLNDESFHLIEKPDKDTNYYRNLVIQRDREISALIEMLKRSGSLQSLNKLTSDQGTIKNSDYSDETGPTISAIAKKVRLKNLMAEARSIAELIRNGKASIGGIKKRMSERFLGLIEAQKLCDDLASEQSKLADNLNRLKVLKSEVTELKKALFIYSQGEISIPGENESKHFIADQVKPDFAKSFDISFGKFDSRRTSVRSIETPVLPSTSSTDLTALTVNANGIEESSKVLRSNYPSVEEDLNPRNYSDDEVNGGSKNNSEYCGKNVEIKNGENYRSRDLENLVDVRVQNLYSIKKPIETDVRNCENTIGGDGDTRTNLSVVNSSERKINLLDEKCEIFQNDVKSSIIDLPRSKEADASLSREISSASRLINFPNDNSADFDSPKFSRQIFTPSELTIVEKISNEESASLKFENDQLNQGKEIATDNDDSFIKSLPLTGDPEIDEEIIAFYRAKRSGGNY